MANLAAILAEIATPLALIAVAIINWWASVDARRASVLANESSQRVQKAVQVGNIKLESIQSTSEKTHILVNSQHTELLKIIAALTKRIAFDNPEDDAAQVAAADAAFAVMKTLAGDKLAK